jgi:23S rRNA (cytosine1962-C5)-methyltransferase
VISGRAVVSSRGEARIRQGHPWIFRSDVTTVEGASPGGIVEVRRGRKSLGVAFFSDRSEIRLRMLTREADLPPDFLWRRLAAAGRLRDRIAGGAQAHRLVHGEGDGLPGLVVDRYGEYCVIQTLTQGMEALKGAVVAALVEQVGAKGILERNDPKVRLLEGLERKVSVLHGEVPESLEVNEGGIRHIVDLRRGQKTGLFLDQRENHAAAAPYARGRVLDAFSYNGGFGLPCARGANEVVAVDASADCVKRIRENAERNQLGNIQAVEANVFDFLRECESRGETFEMIILDPPAFAKNKASLPAARRGYKEINLRALRLLAPGGILFTCTCSYHVHEGDFDGILDDAAADAGARAAVLEKRRQGRDHPVAVGVPETLYLKALVAQRGE